MAGISGKEVLRLKNKAKKSRMATRKRLIRPTNVTSRRPDKVFTPPSGKLFRCYLSLSFWIFLMIFVVEQPSSKFSTSTSPPFAHTSSLPAICSGL